jgi:flagellar hook-length control protein FliK
LLERLLKYQGQRSPVMQFLPITSTIPKSAAGHGHVASTGRAKVPSRPFGLALGGSMAALSGGDGPVRTRGTNALDQAVAQKVNREDFASLIQTLEQAGFGPKAIRELQSSVESSSGATWEQLLGRMAQLRKGQEGQPLSPDQKRDLMSLFQGFGFVPQDAERLAHAVEMGRMDTVLSETAAALATGKKDAYAVNKAGMLLLAERAGGSLEDGQRVRTIIESLGRDGEMGREDIRTILAQLRQIHMADAQVNPSAGQVQTSVGQGGKTALDELSQRIALVLKRGLGRNSSPEHRNGPTGETVRSASAQIRFHPAQEAHQSDRFAERIALVLKGVPAPTEIPEHLHKQGVHPATGDAGRQGFRVKAETPAQAMGPSIGHRPSAEQVEEAAQNTRERGGKLPEQFKRIGQERRTEETTGNDWTRMWEKVRGEVEGLSGGQVRPESVAGTMREARQLSRPMPEPQSRAVLEQVQSGMLRNLGNGVRQLSLRLTPPELGQVQLLLQVHNKELRAVIKTGNHEVSRIVAEQIAHLRETLEQQGLKVMRLEVQTQAENHLTGQWHGAEGHNQAWEQLHKRGLGPRGAGPGVNHDSPSDPEVPHPDLSTSERLNIFA